MESSGAAGHLSGLTEFAVIIGVKTQTTYPNRGNMFSKPTTPNLSSHANFNICLAPDSRAKRYPALSHDVCTAAKHGEMSLHLGLKMH